MPPARSSLATAIALLLLPAAASAQDRPREEDLFGAPAPPAEEQSGPEPPPPDRPGEGELFGAPAPPEATGRPRAEEAVKVRLGETEDPLKLGGVLYLRGNVFSREKAPPSRWILGAPSLLDLYLDARPNDRVRGFVLARTFYDPTQAAPAGPAGLPAGASQGQTLRGLLDQLWLRFDAGRTAFFTVGKQHVKWGVGRFWNPTDFLHPVRRDPLAVFDERQGTTMLRVHLPWEARGWNLYAAAVAEPLVTRPTSLLLAPSAARPTNEVGSVGGAARAEMVVGSVEIGIDGAAQRGMGPRLGLDVSAGIWEIDVRGELALRRGVDVPRVRADPAAPFGYSAFEPGGPRSAAVLSADWTRKYSDEDTFTVGCEYFWNQDGTGDAHLYPAMLVANLFTPFYVGRHYLGAFLLLPRPGSWNLHTFTFSAIANLSDGSLLGRVDWSYTLLTHLRLETWLQAHGGKWGGEFRLGIDATVPLSPCPFPVASGGTCTLQVGAPAVDAGVALRLDL